MTKFFSYRRADSAARTLRVLRAAHPATRFALEPRPDWRLYIRATLPGGASGWVARAPLASIARGAGQ